MYILLISRGIPSDKDPLWGCFEFDQARALRSIGHKVIVLSVDERVRFYKRKIGLAHKVVDGIDCYKMYYVNIDLNIEDLSIQKEELTEVKWFGIDELQNMVDKKILNQNHLIFYIILV